MNPKTFRGQRAGILRQVGQGHTAYWAFIPHPLPPDITYTPHLIQALSAADRAVGELAGLGRTLDNPTLLVRPLMRREAVLSSRIEGTYSDVEDLLRYEVGGFRAGSAADVADVQEVHNYVVALEYGLSRISELPISLRLLREIHAKLMQGVRGEHATPGEFRRSQNWIGAPGSTLRTATFVPPPPEELMPCLDAFEKYLHENDEHPPLVRLAFIHYQFEAIHPFLDGNGRLGRLLIALLLVEWALLPSPLLYLSEFFERRREAYYEHLQAVSVEGDWEAWIIFFLQAVETQAIETIKRIKRLQDLQTEWRERVRKETRSTNALRAMDVFFQSPILSISYVQRALDVAYTSAKSALDHLVRIGIVQRSSAGREVFYYAQDIINAISDLE